MKVIKQIGQGGFGNVNLVEDTNGQQYAQKTFSINQPQPFDAQLTENVKKRFIREASIQAQITHPNIVPVIDSDLGADIPSFIMPLAESNLGEEIQQSRNLNGQYMDALMDIMAGLEELHSMGIYHRDLKPQNVLKFQKDGAAFFTISDFGLMSIKDTQLTALTQTGMQKGSDYYTAPEIHADLKKASASSDIYSIGCILHDFVGTGQRIPCAEIKSDGSPYADILRSCTRPDPSRRFQSVADLREALLGVDVRHSVSTTLEISSFCNLLDSDEPIQLQQWRDIVIYLEDHHDEFDVDSFHQKLKIARIKELIDLDESLAARLSELYANWARESKFNFSYCDGIANRLMAFFELDEINSRVEVLLALLYMGTSHNRWYVERKFMAQVDSRMPENLAKRLALEFRVIGNRVCPVISQLKYSISTDLSSLHPVVKDAIETICKK